MKIKKIAIDPGHGGQDPGVTSENYREKDINLLLATELFARLLSTISSTSSPSQSQTKYSSSAISSLPKAICNRSAVFSAPVRPYK